MHVQFVSCTTLSSVCCFNGAGLEIIILSNNTAWLSTQYRNQNIWKLHHYLYHTGRAAHERVLYHKHSGGNQSQSSRSPSCILGSRSNNSMSGSRLLCLAFWFFGVSFFLSLFAAFVVYPSVFSTAYLRLLYSWWNHTLSSQVSCFFTESTSCFELVRGSSGRSQAEVDVRNWEQETVISYQQQEKSVDSLAAIRSGDRMGTKYCECCRFMQNYTGMGISNLRGKNPSQ